jgi:ADP-ribose pyrophosphatase YjhB (NUDIX family)
VLCHERGDGGLDLVGGKAEEGESPERALRRELEEEYELTPGLESAAEVALRSRPDKVQITRPANRNRAAQEHTIWLYSAHFTGSGDDVAKATTDAVAQKEIAPGSVAWRSLTAFVTSHAGQPTEPYALAVRTAAEALGRPTVLPRPRDGRAVRGQWHYVVQAPGRSRSTRGAMVEQLIPAKFYPLELQRTFAAEGMGPPEMEADESAETMAVCEDSTAVTEEVPSRPPRQEAVRARQRWAGLDEMNHGHDGSLPSLPDRSSLLPRTAQRDYDLAERTWSEYDSTTPVLKEWLPDWFLMTSTLPITVTYELDSAGETWVAVTLVAESCVLLRAGCPKQFGLWILQDIDHLPSYEGRAFGNYSSEARAAEQGKARRSSYLITSRRSDGRWTVIDGVHARKGGVQFINDVRGTGRTPDVFIHADRSVTRRLGHRLEPPRPGLSLSLMAASEVLTTYGPRFWQ